MPDFVAYVVWVGLGRINCGCDDFCTGGMAVSVVFFSGGWSDGSAVFDAESSSNIFRFCPAWTCVP